MAQPPRRIAILKPSALGDVVHAMPILGALRVRFPEAHITWVVNRPYAPLLTGHRHLDAVLTFERRGTLRDMARFAGELRRRRFDLVIDLQGLLRTGLMAAFTGSPRKVGFANAREGATRFYTDRIAVPDPDMHAVDRYWLFAKALGVGDVAKSFDVPIQPTANSWAEAAVRGFPRPWLAVAPGARWLTKRWPPEHFADLLRDAEGTAIILGGQDEAPITASLKSHLRRPVLDLTGRTDIAKLAAVLSLADMVLANDSGPLHLAAALGRPVTAPYTCTSVAKHGPYGMSASAVETAVSCRGSYVRTCDRMDCMAELTPDRLRPILQRTLREWQSNSRSA